MHTYLYFETIVRDLLLSTDELQVMPHGGYETFSDVVSAKGGVKASEL